MLEVIIVSIGRSMRMRMSWCVPEDNTTLALALGVERVPRLEPLDIVLQRSEVDPVLWRIHDTCSDLLTDEQLEKKKYARGEKRKLTASAPIVAIYPHFPPCVSTTNTLFLLADALCLIASHASTSAFKLVSLPRLNSVIGTLLLIVAGRCTIGTWNAG